MAGLYAPLPTPFFVPSPAIRFAEGRWGGDGPFFEGSRLMAPAITLRDDRRGARHWARIARRKLHMRAIGIKRALHCLIETCSRCLIWSPRQPSLVLFSTRY